MTLPADPSELRRLLGRRYRRDDIAPRQVLRVLIRTDAQLAILAVAIEQGLAEALSCYLIAARLPKWADENLVRAFIRAARLEHALVRNGTWAAYHARKAETGEPYTNRRGQSRREMEVA
jgi:hypothetical protein